MSFDPKSKLSSIKGKDYLEVKWRIVWFRDEHPKGSITTEIITHENPMVKATIRDNDGVILSTGLAQAIATDRAVWSGREIEKAETAAIGRALAHAGYGTQFTGEDEGEHLADSPVEQKSKPKPKTEEERPYSPEYLHTKINGAARWHKSNQHRVTDTDRKVVAAAIDAIFEKDTTKRYELCKWLVGEASTKQMESQYIAALKSWLAVENFGDMPSDEARQEAINALPEALKASGQMTLEV